jgi:hypothetical protein
VFPLFSASAALGTVGDVSDARPAERDGRRTTSGLILVVLTAVWIVSTAVFFVAAFGESFCLDACEHTAHDDLLADRRTVASVACACVFPLVAAVICTGTDRTVGAVIFLVLGVAAAVTYGRTTGTDALRDVHRIERLTAPPVPTHSCRCYSGGSCGCPGG